MGPAAPCADEQISAVKGCWANAWQAVVRREQHHFLAWLAWAAPQTYDDTLVRRQTTRKAKFVRLVVTHKCAVLVVVDQFESVRLDSKLLCCILEIAHDQTLTTLRRKTSKPVAFTQHDTKDTGRGMITSRRQVLRGRERRQNHTSNGRRRTFHRNEA